MLRRQLNGSGKTELYPSDIRHIQSKDNALNKDDDKDSNTNYSSNNNTPPNAYGSVGDVEASCALNLNIPPSYDYKIHHKDLSLQLNSSPINVAPGAIRQSLPNNYSRSLSAPPNYTHSAYTNASAPPVEDMALVIEEDYNINADELSPLHDSKSLPELV